MVKQNTKIVGYRVKKIHVKSLNEHVRKFLKARNYKLYAKRKQKTNSKTRIKVLQKSKRETIKNV